MPMYKVTYYDEAGIRVKKNVYNLFCLSTFFLVKNASDPNSFL